MAQGRKRQKGEMNVAGTKKWNGTKWVPVNVARDGQRATRNGKPVVRRNGVWVPYKTSTRSRFRSSASSRATSTSSATATASRRAASASQRAGSRTSTSTSSIPADKRPADMRQGQVYGDDPKSHGRNWSNPYGQVSDKPSEGDRSTWSRARSRATEASAPAARSGAPTTTTSSSSSSSRSSSSRSSSAAARGTSASRTPQSSDMDANFAAFAKAHPKLAAKVKPGQAGYEAIQKALGKGGDSSSTSSSRTAPSNFGPSSDPNEYARNVEASRRRGTSGVGPLRSGQSYSDDVEGSRRPANRSAKWLQDNFKPNGTPARSRVRQGIRAGGQTDRNNQASQASKHYKSGNTFGAYDGGANPQQGSQKDFHPKKSMKQALDEIRKKFKMQRGRSNPFA